MKITPTQIKRSLGLHLSKTIEIDCLDSIESQNGKKILSYLTSEKFIPQLLTNKRIKVIFTTPKLAHNFNHLTSILSKNPKYDFCKFHNYLCFNSDFYTNKWNNQIDKTAIIQTNHIAKRDVSIGKNTEINSGTVIFSRVQIGKNVKIAPNVIIGEEGADIGKNNNKIIHAYHDGGVIIEDNVVMHSTSSIKRGVFGKNTVISKGTTIGSFVNIGHRVQVGSNCFIAPGCVLTGSSKIGSNSNLGTNSVILNGVKVGKNCKIGAGSVVTHDVLDNQTVLGIPAKQIKK
jgi:UDP-3-O-[3-hydroxymyristoyl] glucosamine N-acyltransferase